MLASLASAGAAQAAPKAQPKVESLKLFKVSNDRAGISVEMKLTGVDKKKFKSTDLSVNIMDANGELLYGTFVQDPDEIFTLVMPASAQGMLTVEVILHPYKAPLKTMHLSVNDPGAKFHPIINANTGDVLGSYAFPGDRDWRIIDPKTGALTVPETRQPVRKEIPIAPLAPAGTTDSLDPAPAR
jgi:hypothetical protein